MFLHKLGHIQPDQRVGGIEQFLCKHLDQLGLAHTGRPDKDERCRPAPRRNLHTAAAHRCRDQPNRFVLADDLLFHLRLEAGDPFQLGFPDFGGRNTGPEFDDPREIVKRHRTVQHLRFQFLEFPLDREDLPAQVGDRLIIGCIHLCLEILNPRLELLQPLGHLIISGKLLVAQHCARAGFIQKVDRLVGQIPVGDIPFGEHDRPTGDLFADRYPVVLLVVTFDPLDHLNRVGDRRFLHRDRLEPSLERRILLDMFAVLIEGGRADHLNFAARKGRFQDVGSVH